MANYCKIFDIKCDEQQYVPNDNKLHYNKNGKIDDKDFLEMPKS